jgi:acyl-CoA thioester hydrolase
VGGVERGLRTYRPADASYPRRHAPEVLVTARADFPHFHAIATRWDDNDVYGHVNNVRYFAFFDTAINEWLIREGGLDVAHGDVIGLCAESHCAYTAAIAFPDSVEVGLRAGHIGNSSVRYELAVFTADADEPAATGWFVHVFVDRATRRPVPLPPPIRAALERLAP